MTRLLPGSVCTHILARLGADVVKVEDRNRGDYQRDFGRQIDGASASHQLFNRGKRSISLDLKTNADRLVFDEMIRRSHVLVESFRPGVLDRLGYPEDRLRAMRRDLVITHITGYGSSGPLAAHAGHDINYIAFSGLLDRCGSDGGPPVIPPVPIADVVGGGIVPALLITAYIHRAEMFGEGAVIDASMADTVALLPNMVIAEILSGAPATPGRGLSPFSGGLACYGIYAVQDGYVAVGALEERFWNELCDVADLSQLRANHLAPEKQEEIYTALSAYFACLSRDEVERRFAGRDACVSPVLSYEEMLSSPHATSRHFVEPSQPGESMQNLAFAAMVDGRRLPIERPAPRHGQHTTEVLRDLGFDSSR